MNKIFWLMVFVAGFWAGGYYLRFYYWHHQWYNGFMAGMVATLFFIGMLNLFGREK